MLRYFIKKLLDYNYKKNIYNMYTGSENMKKKLLIVLIIIISIFGILKYKNYDIKNLINEGLVSINSKYGDLKSLAIEMYNSFNCSKKKDNPSDLIRDEEEAFKIGIQMEDENQHWIQRLENMGKKDESR